MSIVSEKVQRLDPPGEDDRGRPKVVRWDDYVMRDARKAGEEEDWKKKTRDRGGWKRLSYFIILTYL